MTEGFSASLEFWILLYVQVPQKCSSHVALQVESMRISHTATSHMALPGLQRAASALCLCYFLLSLLQLLSSPLHSSYHDCFPTSRVKKTDHRPSSGLRKVNSLWPTCSSHHLPAQDFWCLSLHTCGCDILPRDATGWLKMCGVLLQSLPWPAPLVWV